MKKVFIASLVLVSIIPFADLNAATTKVPCTKLTRTLRLGSIDTKTNKDVAKLQRFLKAQGYYTGIVAGGFGAKTKEAVQKFQVATGIYVEGVSRKSSYGVVDSKTRFKIQQMTCTKASITVTDPNTDLALDIGSTKTITWVANNISKVDILLRDRKRGGDPVDTLIVSNLDASRGSYDWTIPSSVEPGNRYSILIRGDGVSDESDFYFLIKAVTRSGGSKSSSGGGGSSGGSSSCRDLYWFDDLHPDCDANGKGTFCSSLPTTNNFTYADTLAACRDKMRSRQTISVDPNPTTVVRGSNQTITWRDSIATSTYNVLLRSYSNSGVQYWLAYSVNAPASGNGVHSFTWKAGDDASGNRIPDGSYYYTICHTFNSPCGYSATSTNTEFSLTSSDNSNNYIQRPVLFAICGDVTCNDPGNGHPVWHARPVEPSDRYYMACNSTNVNLPYYASGAVIADLGSTKTLSKINIDFNQNAPDAPGQSPCSYTIDISTDGNNWSNLSGAGMGNTCSNVGQLVSDTDIAVNSRQARYVRLSYTTMPGTCLALNKFNIMEASVANAGITSNALASVSQVLNRLLNFFKK
jgi:peptidoglycan hydrolase-like protein with peptidoglycan-binding domain